MKTKSFNTKIPIIFYILYYIIYFKWKEFKNDENDLEFRVFRNGKIVSVKVLYAFDKIQYLHIDHLI